MLLYEHCGELTEEQRNSYELPPRERQRDIESFERGFQAQPCFFLLSMLGMDSGSAAVHWPEEGRTWLAEVEARMQGGATLHAVEL